MSDAIVSDADGRHGVLADSSTSVGGWNILENFE
jgi:hypothetical protein